MSSISDRERRLETIKKGEQALRFGSEWVEFMLEARDHHIDEAVSLLRDGELGGEAAMAFVGGLAVFDALVNEIDYRVRRGRRAAEIEEEHDTGRERASGSATWPRSPVKGRDRS
jgi:hypothetical protein